MRACVHWKCRRPIRPQSSRGLFNAFHLYGNGFSQIAYTIPSSSSWAQHYRAHSFNTRTSNDAHYLTHQSEMMLGGLVLLRRKYRMRGICRLREIAFSSLKCGCCWEFGFYAVPAIVPHNTTSSGVRVRGGVCCYGCVGFAGSIS